MPRILLALAVVVAGLSTVPAAHAASSVGDTELRAAARVNDLTPAELRQVLRDPAMDLDDQGRLFVADDLSEHAEAAGHDEAESVTLQPVAPLEDTFELHSLPNSTRTIYLDFDGVTLNGASQWVASNGWPTGGYDGLDLDGEPSTFGADERTVIQDVWARVADDFASFDVDVTTEQPAAGGLVRTSAGDPTYGIRVAITADPDAKLAACAPNPSCSTVGLAYVGTFDDVNAAGAERYGPAWALSDFEGDAALIAETINHEVGHTLGLEHASGPVPSELFAPTMFPTISSAAVTHWVTAPSTSQDQRSVITSTGLALRADDHPDTAASAVSFASTTRSGVISTPADKDAFLLPGCAAGSTITARPADAGPNLDIVLTVQSDGDSPVVAAPGTSPTGGMDASITLPGATSTASVIVEGGPSTEYTDYGSVGAYTLDVVGCDVPPIAPSAPRAVRATSVGSATSVSWAAPATTGGNSSLTYQVALDGGAWEAADGPTSHTWSTAAGRHRVALRAVGAQNGPTVEVLSITTPSTPISFWFEDHGQAGARYLHWNLPAGGSGGAPALQLRLMAVEPAGTTWTLPNPSNGRYDWAAMLGDGTTWTGWLINTAGESGKRRVVVRTTPVAPGAPMGLALSATVPDAGTATVTWARPLDDGGRPLTYEVRLDEGGWLPVGGAETSYTFTGVTAGARTAQIRSVTSADTSAAASLEFEMDAGPPAPTPPGVVPGVAAAVDPTTRVASITWGAAESSLPLSAYVVSIDGAPQTLDCAPACPSGLALPPLPRGSAHTVTVRAVNAVGTGPAGTAVGFTIPALAPDAVTGVVVSQLSSTSLSVTWQAPADNGAPIQHYTVQVGSRAVVVAAPTKTTTVAGLTPGLTYPVSVSATNAVGTGLAGSTTGTLPALPTTLPPSAPTQPPGTPTLQKPRPGARGGPVTVVLRWRAPATTGGAALTSYRIVGYQVDKRGRVTRQRTWTVPAGRLKTELKVRKGVRTRFVIQAVNSAGPSRLSPKSAPVAGR